MGKRRWSGGSSSPPSKLRNPPHIRALHAKTVSMLFEGANRTNGNNRKNDANPLCNNMENTFRPIGRTGARQTKQMCIDRQGGLGGLCFNGPVEEFQYDTCSICKSNLDHLETVRCSYCEIAQCPSCAKICRQCNTPTCNNCSILDYEGYSRVVCLSCYR